MNDPIARHAARPVPRYTSYPTAPHFRRGFPDSAYRDWLVRLDPGAAVSLYLHVPFCRQICWYCACNMKLAARAGPIADYVEALIAEIDLLSAALPARMRVRHLHWGGGTPTALDPADLVRVTEHLRRRFDLEPGAELAIESDPRTLTPEMARTIGAIGFTRASLGIQEFDHQVQEAINRIQPPDMVARAVAMLRDAGVAGINFDLIYGLPHQSAANLLATVATCLGMAPDRFALFGYAHVPWMAKNQRMIPAAALPDAAARADQAGRAASALIEAGYDAIGIDHFARPGDPLAVAARAGRLRRNFQGYTTDAAETLLGLGTTAIGRTPSGFVQNIGETGAWSRAVAAGRLPVGRGLALDDDDRLRAQVIEALMCGREADTASLGARFGFPPDWCADELARLGDLAADGLVTVSGGCVALTGSGRGLARIVAAVFDRHLAASEARHSVAV